MSESCNCGCLQANLTSATAVQQDDPTICPTKVHETVCVQAQVTISPHVVPGTVHSFCMGNPIIGACHGTPSESVTCVFTVSQNICVEVPLEFSATAVAVPAGIVCGTPLTGPCQGTSACTHTLGFYRNHPDVVDALITAAGGTIILGIDALGLSYSVTTSNAALVFDFNVPSPPAPNTPPFSVQYQLLYAQLLTADLNVLSGATCPFATAAIAAANTFLATSPAGGKAGAPEIQDQLALFNEGNAPGCPMHCE